MGIGTITVCHGHTLQPRALDLAARHREASFHHFLYISLYISLFFADVLFLPAWPLARIHSGVITHEWGKHQAETQFLPLQLFYYFFSLRSIFPHTVCFVSLMSYGKLLFLYDGCGKKMLTQELTVQGKKRRTPCRVARCIGQTCSLKCTDFVYHSHLGEHKPACNCVGTGQSCRLQHHTCHTY